MEHSILLAQLDKQIDTLANEVGGDISFYSNQQASPKHELPYENTSNQSLPKDYLFSTGPAGNSFNVQEQKVTPSQDVSKEACAPNDKGYNGSTSTTSISSLESIADQGKIHDMHGILSALENCQIKIQELEKEKSESKIQIKSLEQELNSARQLLFLKAGNSGSGSGDITCPEPLYKSQSLQRLQELKSNWIQDARNEVEELRRKVEMEKQRQSKRQSKEFLFDDGLNSANHDFFLEESKQNDKRGREMNKLKMYNRKNENSDSSLQKDDSKLSVDIDKIQPPARAHVRSPSYSPVRSGLEDSEQIMDSDFGFLKKDQIGQLKDEILSTRNNLKDAKSKKDKSVRYEKLVVPQPKVPAWKNVQGRPKSAAASSLANRKPHTSKVSRKSSITLERELPFTVGQNPGKSHSVTANIQKVYSLLKSHNPAICTVCSDKSCDSKCNQKTIPNKPVAKAVTKIPTNEIVRPSSSSLTVLATNLSSLEKEFDRLKGEYNALVAQYETALGNKTSLINLKEVGTNLKHVIQSMETKSDQIAILKQILYASKNPKREKPASRPLSPTKARENLGLLKNSRVVQESLLH